MTMNIAMKATTTAPTAMVTTISMRVKPRCGGSRASVARPVARQRDAAARRIAHRDVDAPGSRGRHAGERARRRGGHAHRVSAQGRDRIAELIVRAHVCEAIVFIDEIPASAPVLEACRSGPPPNAAGSRQIGLRDGDRLRCTMASALRKAIAPMTPRIVVTAMATMVIAMTSSIRVTPRWRCGDAPADDDAARESSLHLYQSRAGSSVIVWVPTVMVVPGLE